jgi:hypothetical protein
MNLAKRGIILLLFFACSNLFAQEESFEEQSFFKKLEQSYYSLASTNVKNFTVLLTNLKTETFAKNNWNNAEIFPLQLIWLSSNKLFLAEQGVPSLNDSTKKLYTPMVSDLKKQVTGILFDFKRFYLNGINKSISQDYVLRERNDIVEIKFHSFLKGDTTSYTYYFGKNGLCLKIETVTLATNTHITTYPQFKIVKTKWLITGWEVQITKNDQIETGFIIELKSKILGENWVPSEMYITVQQSKTRGTTFQDVIKFRNFLFNQPLQYIQSAK